MALIGRDKKIEYLQKVPMFQECTRQELAAITRISEVIEVSAGTAVVRAGEPGNEFFLILEGTARVGVWGRKGFRRLGPGAFFGEMSLLDGGPRSATVAAETSLRLLVVNRRAFWTLLSEAPHLNYKILLTLTQRIRQAESDLLA